MNGIYRGDKNYKVIEPGFTEDLLKDFVKNRRPWMSQGLWQELKDWYDNKKLKKRTKIFGKNK